MSSSLVLVGRNGPLASLRAALEQCALGRGTLAVVSGEAGIGKTALGTALADETTQAGAVRVTVERGSTAMGPRTSPSGRGFARRWRWPRTRAAPRRDVRGRAPRCPRCAPIASASPRSRTTSRRPRPRGDARRAAACERDMLAKELARATGLGGDATRAGSATERARVNVQRRLRDAVGRIATAAPELGGWLERAVRTGTYCSFQA